MINKNTLIISLLLITLLAGGCSTTSGSLASAPNSSNSSASPEPGKTPEKTSNTEAADKGKPKKPLKFSDLGGRQYTVQDLRGKVVMLVYWATWCPPCRKEIPDLNKLHENYSDRGALILAISQDETVGILKGFLSEQELGRSIRYPIIYGPDYLEFFGLVEALPTMVLIDKTGKVVLKHQGSAPYESLAKLIEEHL